MKLALIFIALLASTARTNRVRVLNSLSTENSQDASKGQMLLRIDDQLVDVKINGVSFSFNGIDINNKDITKAIPVSLKVNTEITITAKNLGGKYQIGGAFIFKNPIGNELTIFTGSDWKCNGKPAKVFDLDMGKNDQPNDKILSKGKAIWAEEYNDLVTCQGILKQPKVDGTISVVFDDFYKDVKVNGISLPKPNVNDDWMTLREFKTPMISGDTVELCGQNVVADLTQNSASIIASIRFTNNDGQSQTINTGKDWICDDKPAVELGRNDDPKNIWFTARGKPIDKIENSANYIWGSNKQQTTCCKTVLYKPRKEARMNLMLDKYLDKLEVNGEEILFNRVPNEVWMEPKYFSILVRSGDIVAISMRSTVPATSVTTAVQPLPKADPNDPVPALIATIYYLNSCGITAEANTGVSWFCDDQIPKIVTKKTNYCPDVSEQAKWISTSKSPTPEVVKCSVTLK